VATPIPEDIKREVDKSITTFKPLAGGITWVKASNLHFTLRFLGDIPLDSVARLREKLTAALTDTGPFTIDLAGLGCFPDLRRPRVIWIGASGEIEKMKALAETVERVCRECGFGNADKPFAPHLTIGRIKKAGDLGRLTAALNTAAFRSEPFTVDLIVVFKSVLTPAGPIYTPLEKIKLSCNR